MKTFTAYVVKQKPLSVEYIEVRETGIPGMVIETGIRPKTYMEGLWFRDPDKAAERACELREVEVSRYERRIKNLRKLTFKI